MYLEEDYNNLDVKKVIDASTADIMNNINDKIIEDARRSGSEAFFTMASKCEMILNMYNTHANWLCQFASAFLNY